VFVVNSLGENLSRILLPDGTVAADALILGASPKGIAVGPDGRQAVIVSSLSNRVDVVDLDALAVLRSIDVGPGSNPYDVAIVGGAAYISCFLTDEVVHADIASGTIIRRIPVGRAPEGLLYAEDTGDLYVALTGYTPAGYLPGTVAVIATDSDTVRTRLTVGLNPQSFARAAGGIVHVVCTGNYGPEAGRLFQIEPTGPAVIDSLEIGGTPVCALAFGDTWGITAGYTGGLKVFDSAHDTAVEMAALLGETWFSALAYDEADSVLYVSDFDDSVVHAVDPWADVHLRSFRVGHGPVALAVRR
jgi:DNA-binding beta-propeller fold protein YncE